MASSTLRTAAAGSLKIQPERTAILVCDIQDRFRKAIYGFEEMCLAGAKVIRASAVLKIPSLVTEQNPKALGATVPELGLDNLPKDLLPLGDAVGKTLFSMMVPQVVQALTERNVSSVVIFGIESHVCVLQTTLDCLERGLDVHVLADAVSSCNSQEIPIALERMRQSGARITTTESILFQLMVDASRPNFKAFSQIIKEEKDSTAKALTKLAGHARL